LLGWTAGGAVVGGLVGWGAGAVVAKTALVAKIGTSFGTLGTLAANNSKHIINWGKTTAHGLQRMAERGATQSMANNWVKTGKALQQSGGQILYVTKQGAVCVNQAGQVITAYTSKYFDAAMQKVIEQLFGK